MTAQNKTASTTSGMVPLNIAPSNLTRAVPTRKKSRPKEDVKVLFTTPYLRRERYDFYKNFARPDIMMTLTSRRIMQPGLRFIKQNIPQIEILEFPSWQEFTRVVDQGWDVIGFSFYSFEVGEIFEMAEYARKAGVKELWAGNYGVYNPNVDSVFDKVFDGYSEHQIALELGVTLEDVQHPPLLDSIGLQPFGGPIMRTGWLYTARGCPLKCTFCQTPAFAPNVVTTSMDSIDRVLRYYKKHDVQLVTIYDEIFGIHKAHASEVVSLLAKYELPWFVMTRSNLLIKNVGDWHENGMVSAFFGIESLNPDTLRDIKKKQSTDLIRETLEALNRHNIVTVGSYIIGFPADSVESIKRDFQQLQQLKPDFMKIFVATPYPNTPLWDEADRGYGIDTSDWSKFDGKHLVWKHPRLTDDDTGRLLKYGYGLFNSEEYVLKFSKKRILNAWQQKGPRGLHQLLLSSFHARHHGGAAAESSQFFQL